MEAGARGVASPPETLVASVPEALGIAIRLPFHRLPLCACVCVLPPPFQHPSNWLHAAGPQHVPSQTGRHPPDRQRRRQLADQ